jgi:hypothetical protein
MASISGFNVYTQLTRKTQECSRIESTFQLQGGDGASLNYPKGGIPVSAGAFGFPYGQIDYLMVVDSNGTGYDFLWNRTSSTIQIWTPGATGGVFVEAATGTTPSAVCTVVAVGY